MVVVFEQEWRAVMFGCNKYACAIRPHGYGILIPPSHDATSVAQMFSIRPRHETVHYKSPKLYHLNIKTTAV